MTYDYGLRSVSIIDTVSYYNILFPTFLYFIAIFMIFPLTTQILIIQVCHELNEDDCDNSNVSSRASFIVVLNSLTSSIPSFLLSGIYGSLSDNYGRKIAIITPVIGLTIYSLAVGFIQWYGPSWYIYIIVTASFILGLSGSYVVFVMAVFAYTSDATRHTTENRTFAYSITEAAIYGPKIFAPIVGGTLALYYGFTVSITLTICLLILTILYTIFIPESLQVDITSDSKIEMRLSQTFHNIKLLFTYHQNKDGICTETNTRPSHTSPLRYIATAFMIYFFCYSGSSGILVLYVKHKFHWGPDLVGYYDAVEGAIYTFSMVCVPALVNYIIRAYRQCSDSFDYSESKDVSLISWIQIGLFFRYACSLYVKYFLIIALHSQTIIYRLGLSHGVSLDLPTAR
jgi:MFS family permease